MPAPPPGVWMGWLLMQYLHTLPAVSYCERDIAKKALFAHCDMRKKLFCSFLKFCKFLGLVGSDGVLY